MAPGPHRELAMVLEKCGRRWINSQHLLREMVRLSGLEPPRCRHHRYLKPARLPIPPQPQRIHRDPDEPGGSPVVHRHPKGFCQTHSLAIVKRGWCGREDLNLHGVSPTAPSTLRVYQFRHSRIAFDRRPFARPSSIRQPNRCEYLASLRVLHKGCLTSNLSGLPFSLERWRPLPPIARLSPCARL